MTRLTSWAVSASLSLRRASIRVPILGALWLILGALALACIPSAGELGVAWWAVWGFTAGRIDYGLQEALHQRQTTARLLLGMKRSHAPPLSPGSIRDAAGGHP